LIIERFKLPASQEDVATQQLNTPLPPHQGSLPTMFQAGYMYNQDFGDGIGLRFRPVYYDTLSPNIARPDDSMLSMFDLHIIYASAIDEVWLRQLDLVSIESLNTSKTGLPGDGGYAWALHFGLKSQYSSCYNCTIFHFSSSVGKATELSSNTTVRVMLEANAQTPYKDIGTIGGAVRLALVTTPMPSWKMQISGKRLHYLNRSKTYLSKISWEQRYHLSREVDLYLDYVREGSSDEVSLGIAKFW